MDESSIMTVVLFTHMSVNSNDKYKYLSKNFIKNKSMLSSSRI